jgi:hypothetical protein
MQSELWLMLSTQKSRNLGRETSNGFAIGIDDMPVSGDFTILRRIGTKKILRTLCHGGSSSFYNEFCNEFADFLPFGTAMQAPTMYQPGTPCGIQPVNKPFKGSKVPGNMAS